MIYLKLLLLIPLLFSLTLFSPNFSHSISDNDDYLPYWHYNHAKWWSEGKISDDELLHSIIVILNESPNLTNTNENKIPLWFSTVATWFSNYQINDTEYRLILAYLHSQNILKLSEPLISNTLQEYNFNTFPLIQTFEKDVNLFEAGNYAKDKFFLVDGNTQLIDILFNFKNENTFRYESLKNSSNSVVVVPTFTFSAYTEPGFYTFYRGDCNEELHGKLFQDSNCLTIPINYDKPTKFTSSTIGINILHLLDYPLITDIDVDKNPEILLNYDKVIMLHNEYVTTTMFDAITSHPNVIYLYPNALYAEINVNYDDDTISLIRGHNYPNPLIRNGFDWKYDNSLLEYELECIDWEFEKISNGHMLNCYPEYALYSDELLLRTLNEL